MKNLERVDSKNLNRQETASAISRLKSDLLSEWEVQSRKEVPAAKGQSRLALRDSLPKFMDRLVETLKSENPNTELKENVDVAREHAEDRANLPEYSIGEVIHEYHILRNVIAEALEAEASLDFESLKIINKIIEQSIRDAADRYVEIETGRQKQQSKETEDAKIEAVRANAAKSAFLANMSHEIRTPLGAIMGFVNLLKDSGLGQEETANYISIIERNSDHVLRIIDDILDLTKVEAGKMVIENLEFSLVEFLADFSSLAGIKARSKGIAFEFKAETLLPELIVTDITRLRQILTNVVGNAIKFTEEGRVELSVKYAKNDLEFKVTDTGRGISHEQRGHLFQAFSQADSSTTRKFGGTGLGLVLTRKLSQALGGDFFLTESQIGKGSTFSAHIPVKLSPTSQLVPVKSMQLKSVDTSWEKDLVELNGLEILLVEDSPDNQFLIQQMLKKTGARITLADDGAAGVKLALSRRFDVILCDIQMPVMDGHDAVRTLRSQDYRGPIVALTAHAMKEECDRATASGFSHFLSKPINKKSLMDMLALIHSPLSLRL